ncbi:MAG: 4Fe-4S dicluster domain-containing protein [bacterium]
MYSILAPQKTDKNGLFLEIVTSDNQSSIVYDQARAANPMKTFLLPPIDEVVGDHIEPEKPLLFLGVKASGLAALPILDQAFGGDFTDPLYQKRRKNSVIVSSDCTQPWDTCFCTLVGGQPYPQQGFDLNLSKVWDGFVIEVGTDRGNELLKGHEEVLKELVKEEANALEKQRSDASKKVVDQNKKYELSRSHKEVLTAGWNKLKVWKEHTETCVECGACNLACPTCHCYFLDDVTRKKYVRLRGWDACMFSGYAVTAGGGTPRPLLHERLRNRYTCKFKYLHDNFGQYGCTGCGRCIEGCQGDIEMRACIRDLDKK